MTGRPDKTHPALNLVASDLFFGLGAVMLVVVAALSLGLQAMVTRVLADQGARAEDTMTAAASLTARTGLVLLLADGQGLHRLQGGARTSIPLDDLWQSDAPDLWLAEDPILVITPAGQDTAFLTFSRAASSHPGRIRTLRLPQECRDILQDGQDFRCQP